MDINVNIRNNKNSFNKFKRKVYKMEQSIQELEGKVAQLTESVNNVTNTVAETITEVREQQEAQKLIIADLQTKLAESAIDATELDGLKASLDVNIEKLNASVDTLHGICADPENPVPEIEQVEASQVIAEAESESTKITPA